MNSKLDTSNHSMSLDAKATPKNIFNVWKINFVGLEL